MCLVLADDLALGLRRQGHALVLLRPRRGLSRVRPNVRTLLNRRDDSTMRTRRLTRSTARRGLRVSGPGGREAPGTGRCAACTPRTRMPKNPEVRDTAR